MTEAPQARFKRHQFPAEIIAHAVWLYFRFPLSLRDVEDLLAERGIIVSFQTVSEWAAKFGVKFVDQLWLDRRLRQPTQVITTRSNP